MCGEVMALWAGAGPGAARAGRRGGRGTPSRGAHEATHGTSHDQVRILS